ncbi:DUF4199 domain-containing protein [Polaribacter sp. ALD11]|uniref:DUF4199 domain-containing protein n=1 Tax=Polaribacter sp. ALD11 TaxID=2058137 RepID=UPI000C315F4C|nr:DUF4199 domain-containing protein [Polaribacter sp. ALD11]AUC84876.1 DUF4199 domain-containing protein [Polaribacter sp. ALD11]
MENQVNSKGFIVNNGVILGVASVIFALVLYATGNHLKPHWSASVINAIIFIGTIIYGIKQYKAANNGFLSWGQGVKVGVGVAIVGGLILVIYNYLFTNFIEPDFMQQMMDIQNQAFLDQGMSEEQVEAANQMGKAFQGPFLLAALGIISYAIGGFVVAAIAAAIMKKSEEETY